MWSPNGLDVEPCMNISVFFSDSMSNQFYRGCQKEKDSLKMNTIDFFASKAGGVLVD